MSDDGAPAGVHRPAASLADPAILLPFLVVTFIWGSTWLVIRDQIGSVPASWSVAYRFAVAGIAMAALAMARGVPMAIGRNGMLFAAALGVAQFTLNFNFVYRAEAWLTSGVVAVLYALLILPNSLLGWAVFRQPVGRAVLLGGGIAIIGVALLFMHEYRAATAGPAQVLGGMAFALCGLMSASIANVMQGAQIARRLPMLSVLAWAMLIGAVVDAAFAWWQSGPPVFDPRPAYVGGILYLAIAGSVVTFPLYFRLIQRVGPSRAAFSGVLVPVIAMLLSTLFEGYRWSLLAVAGAALAIVGVLVAIRARAS
ncbi:DMT family transporter [Sphingobium aquiterrae]|uniref:DMT family transporter n=1 Tax=Sphingobium aquiterrae TaxID=2038656 RepID=UPI0030163005